MKKCIYEKSHPDGYPRCDLEGDNCIGREICDCYEEDLEAAVL